MPATMSNSGETKRKAVVLLSGGLDSMVCAGLAREAGYEVLALTIDYHQRHRVELDAAKRIAADLDAFKEQIISGEIEVPTAP